MTAAIAAAPAVAQVAEQQTAKSAATKAANTAVKESQSTPKPSPPPKRPQPSNRPSSKPSEPTPDKQPFFDEQAAKQVKNTGKTLQTRVLRSAGSGNHYVRLLKAEWLFGMLLIFLYPTLKPGFANQDFAKWISRQIAWTAVFIMLLLTSSISVRIARLCAAFGGLALLALMLAPYVKDGQVNFDMTGAKSLQAAIDKLVKASGVGSSSGNSPTLPDEEVNRTSESVQRVNLGDGMGPQVYRLSESTGRYFPQSEFQRNMGGLN